jgi:hypothetical protein
VGFNSGLYQMWYESELYQMWYQSKSHARLESTRIENPGRRLS